MNLTDKKISIFGIQGSGKTHIVKLRLLNAFKKPLIYEVNPDYRDVPHAIIYTPLNKSILVLDNFCKKVIQLGKAGKIDCFVLDEADLFFTSNYDLATNLNDLIINHRHYGLALIFISRRPQDIPTKIVESCHFIFVFQIEGENVLRKFKNIHPKFEDLMKDLSLERHNFVLKEIGHDPILCSPI